MTDLSPTIIRTPLREFVARAAQSAESANALDEALGVLPIGAAPAKAGPWLAGGAVRRVLIGQKLDSDLDWDLGRKRLAAHKLSYATASMRRLIKYTRQGFTACAGCMADMLEQVVASPEIIRRETEYVD